jgi:signal transduction histidine kinase
MTTNTSAAAPHATASATNVRTVVHLLGIDSVHVLAGFPVALASFVVLVVGVAVGLSTVFIVGLPILAGTLYAARAFADLERHSIARVLGRPQVRPHYRAPDPDAGPVRTVLTPITQPQFWLDAVYGVLRLPVAVFTFVVTVTWWAGAVSGILYWAYDWALPRSPGNVEVHELLGLPDTVGSRIAFNTAIGVFFLFTLPLIVRGCALLQANLARTMLTGFAEVRDRITVLEEQRAAAVSAEATALRKLERDIHDGPQQRLVRLALDLGRAQKQLNTDPAGARQTLDEALAQTRETLAELRALSRGIAPPVLVDRGLPSALAALAGRSTVPVDLAVDAGLGTPAGRLEPAVENAAYFVVAEALANVAKHSGATECALTVARAGRRLGIVVTDDGVGGAHLAKGHGLAGLADRVRATGGKLAVTSPEGGPTEVRAELPC